MLCSCGKTLSGGKALSVRLFTIQISLKGQSSTMAEISPLTRFMEIREACGKLSPGRYWLKSY